MPSQHRLRDLQLVADGQATVESMFVEFAHKLKIILQDGFRARVPERKRLVTGDNLVQLNSSRLFTGVSTMRKTRFSSASCVPEKWLAYPQAT